MRTSPQRSSPAVRWPGAAGDQPVPPRRWVLAGAPDEGGERAGYDRMLAVVALALVGFGVVMVYSASAIRAQERFGDPLLFLKRQALWALLGLAGMQWALRLDYRRLQRWTPAAVVVALGLLGAVLIPHVGVRVNGARRWIRLLGVSFQPAEFSKLALIFFLASYYARRADKLRSLVDGFLPPLMVTALFAGLVILQPNFGTAVILLLLAGILGFVGGARIGHIAVALGCGVPLLCALMLSTPHVRTRLVALLDPARASSRAVYQVTQSFYALGPGGLLGRGLGDSMQKLFYLPEPHTDFIFAIVGEELGFLGAAAVVSVYGLFLWRGTRIALRAPDAFGGYLAMGITGGIVGQAAINMGVVLGLLPTTGVPLPFLSFGGSSLFFTLTSVGVLLSISQEPCGRPRGGIRTGG
ncbi:MAG TPA: putative lipid II flippase FtsW [Candidatus Sulfotelmatobacter sp.]|nr:putative lipid II flippase FtsW [Candidatus Sulfotelmatobacter sp.]